MTEGRPLKSIKKQHEIDHPNKDQKDGNTSNMHRMHFSGNAKPEFVNGFRPTMPGNSPGAGHSFVEHRLQTQSEAMASVSHIHPSSTEHTNDSRPTGPGHSPGAGHSIQN
ncbi:hypothetical protein L1887_10450 [Cichorium endivia]|nr:hypothetical protein L1887_10450 [Cichorium endivia]